MTDIATRPEKAKVGFYFDAVAGAADTVRAMLRAQTERYAADLPSGVAYRVATRVTDMPLLPHQQVMANSPKPFDFAYQLSADDADALGAMEGAVVALGEALGALVDVGNALVLVGREIAITSGDGPIYNIMPLRRIPALSHAEFMHHWYDRHASLGEGVEGVRYRQNHVDHAATGALAERMGLAFEPLDGLTESYFDSVDAAVAILSQEDVAVGAIEDERRFIHHDRSQFAIYETLA